MYLYFVQQKNILCRVEAKELELNTIDKLKFNYIQYYNPNIIITHTTSNQSQPNINQKLQSNPTITIKRLTQYNKNKSRAQSMKSVFRIYAKTSKPNDQYLYNQLLSFGLQPKYEELMHAFYCTANFNQILKLSYESYTVQSLYLSIGHKYPLNSPYLEPQQAFNEYFSKLSIQNYLPMQRNLIENLTLKFLIRESSPNIPSQNAMISYFTNFLNKQIITKQYKGMMRESNGKAGDGESRERLDNYYDIKQIVEKKWMYEDEALQKQQHTQHKLISNGQSSSIKNLLPNPNNHNHTQSRSLSNTSQTQNNSASSLAVQSSSLPSIQSCPPLPFQPNILMYIRRNHIRTLLKLNKQSMHKHGWRRNVGWGPIRQSLAASILYRTGIIDAIRNANQNHNDNENDNNNNSKKQVTLWDPFCGSGTFGLVALAMANRLRVRQQTDNFIWNKLPIYKPEYLAQYVQECKNVLSKQAKFNVFCSDIDIEAVKNSVSNFKAFVNQNPEIKSQEQQKMKSEINFMNVLPRSKIFQIVRNSIYVGHGDFQEFGTELQLNKLQQKLQSLQSSNKSNQIKISQSNQSSSSTSPDPNLVQSRIAPITIITNLPYLSTRSKAHHQMNQLQSIYKRFNQMIAKYGSKGIIENVFVVVDAQGMGKRGHFMSNQAAFITVNAQTNKKGQSKKRNKRVSKDVQTNQEYNKEQQTEQQQKQQQWRIIDHFSNGGIEIVLLGWKHNKIGWGQLQVYQQNENKLVDSYSQQRASNLQQYRCQSKDLLDKKYDLPPYLVKSKGLRGVRRVVQKKKERHLRALYQAFAKRRDRDIVYAKYARKNLVARLAQRGQKWRRKNMTLMGKSIENKQEVIKREFESRIEEAIKRSEEIKQRKKSKNEKTKRKW